jgi:glycosyltransferase involved in cell wall biosynthesis
VGPRDREALVVKIAYFSPMPPESSGIADYSALLVPALRKHLDVTVVKRGTKRPPRGVDATVYHIGNNPDVHGWILDALRRTPGIVVLHDFVLHHLVAGVTIGRRDGHGYLDAMEREHGVVGRLLAHGVLDKRIPPLWEARPEDFPLTGEVLSLATGVVAHSRYVEEHVRAAGYAGPVAVVPHPAWPDPQVPPAELVGEPLIGAFGNVNQSKRVPQLLEAFARLRSTHPGAVLLLVGATSPGFDLERRLQRLGLDGEGIAREGYVDERRLWALMAACDVHVSLRSPTMGETSGTAIRALVLGKPLVVSDVGWFAELPGDVALKVTVGDREAAELAAALRLLGERPEVRRAMGEAAGALARTEHDLERAAELQAAAFERLAGGEAVDAAVLREVSDAAASVGVAPGSPEASEIARRLSELHDLGG